MAQDVRDIQEAPAGVTYQRVDAAYFEKRGLRRYAGVASLWALGVGAVISGEFSGWNFGLASGGWGGMLVAAILIAIMYLGLVFCIAEMSPALPHTGGAYSFARTAMGPWGGFITGLCENVEYVLTPAVVVFFIGSYLGSIFGTPTGVPAGLLDRLLRHLRGAQHCRCRAVLQGDDDRHPAGARLPGRVLDQRDPGDGFQALGAQYRRRAGRRAGRAARRQWAVPARSACGACWRPCRSRSGCSSRSSNCRWPPRNRSIPSGTCPRASSWRC